ncbi:MAG: thermonuclease family protein [Candidatus Andersenbacteria bacterium]
MKHIVLLTLVCGSISFLWQPSVFAATTSQAYKVTKVVDGDTIDVQIGKKVERIRIIGMDTPETVDPRKPVQCFGKEASNKAKAILSSKNVRLESDILSGERDKYGRLLRYIYLPDGSSFEKLMIGQGYAHEYTYNSIPYKYQADYKKAQKDAQVNKRGLWSSTSCSGNMTQAAKVSTISTSKTVLVKPAQSTTTPAVKKSVNNLCHAKGTRYYNQTKTFTSYATIKACLASGGNLPKL